MLSAVAATAMNRVAVVTGSNKGIGFFIALQLATSGLFSNVIVACRDPTRGHQAVRDLQGRLSSHHDDDDDDNTAAQQQQQQQQKSPITTTTTTTKAVVSYLPLTLGDPESHDLFQRTLERDFGRLDVLVNNAATAFKGDDPTPFAEQTGPTLDVNFRATLRLTQRLLPLLRTTGSDPRIVNVASMAGHLQQLSSDALREELTSTSLTLPRLCDLVDDFERAARDGSHRAQGWGGSNYGTSKLALIAATKVLAREEEGAVRINCCCPGYCDTDMTSHRGTRPPAEGARNAVLPATMVNCPTGQFFKNGAIAEW